MTPGDLFRISLRMLGIWTIVRTLAQSAWSMAFYSRMPSANLLNAGGVTFVEIVVGFLLIRSASKISSRFHFEPDELRQSGELRLDAQHALQVGIQVLGIVLMVRSISPWTTLVMLMADIDDGQRLAGLLQAGIYLLGGLILLLNAGPIAARWESPAGE